MIITALALGVIVILILGALWLLVNTTAEAWEQYRSASKERPR